MKTARYFLFITILWSTAHTITAYPKPINHQQRETTPQQKRQARRSFIKKVAIALGVTLPVAAMIVFAASCRTKKSTSTALATVSSAPIEPVAPPISSRVSTQGSRAPGALHQPTSLPTGFHTLALTPEVEAASRTAPRGPVVVTSHRPDLSPTKEESQAMKPTTA